MRRISTLIFLLSGIMLGQHRPQLGVSVVNQNLTPLPPMGWNAWMIFDVSIGDQYMRDTADGMVYYGLLAAGYTNIGMDNGWAQATRVNGDLTPSLNRGAPSFLPQFPSGMAPCVAYVHSKGLKFGGYTSAGNLGCGSWSAGSNNYEGRDAAQFAAWGWDYLDMDATCQSDIDPAIAALRWSKALRATGRPMFLTGGFGVTNSALWCTANGDSMCRIATDMGPAGWGLMSLGFTMNSGISQYSGPNHWNYMDVLMVGQSALSDTQGQTNISLWAIQASPLTIGTDLRIPGCTSCSVNPTTGPTANTIATLSNPEVIAVDQDSLGITGLQVSSISCGSATCQVWAKPLSSTNALCGGSLNCGVIGLFNLDSSPHDITATMATVQGVFPQFGAVSYSNNTNLWGNWPSCGWGSGSKVACATSIGTITTTYTATSVPAYGVALIKVADCCTYYVSNAGSDSAAGTLVAPWRTVAKVNAQTFSAGQSIGFQSGDTWREQLTIPTSGSKRKMRSVRRIERRR